MIYSITPVNKISANKIVTWRYEEPYTIYNMEDTEESISELLSGSFYSVADANGNLIGYFCIGESARVPAGDSFGAYDESGFTDIGLGMKPDLCGKGMGGGFLRACMEYAKANLDVKQFRLTVASFNKRAVKVYEKVGFTKIMSFERATERCAIEFIVMEYGALFNESYRAR